MLTVSFTVKSKGSPRMAAPVMLTRSEDGRPVGGPVELTERLQRQLGVHGEHGMHGELGEHGEYRLLKVVEGVFMDFLCSRPLER
jgi:hypothetical protein